MTASPIELLPPQPVLRVLQSPGKPRKEQLTKSDHLIVILPEKPANSLWQQVPEGQTLIKLTKKRKLTGQIAHTRMKNQACTGITLSCLSESGKGNKTPGSFELLTHAGSLSADALKDHPSSVTIMVLGFVPDIEDKIVQAMVLALCAHNFAMPTFKSKPEKQSPLKTLHISGTTKRIELTRTLAEADGLNLARWLTALPPNKLDAANYRKVLGMLAKQYNWQVEFLDEKKLHRAGAGAFLAVAQGNATKDAGIMHLHYQPKKARKGKAPLALVGKGIIFDTGGTNLKPFKGMLDMHTDMAGSAVAVATLVTLSKLQIPFAIDCWLAITENRIGNKAYKSRDIVTASNGINIEVIHTDAEGRMALADTLALAGKQKPKTIIDFATLTGSCVAALTDRYSGVLTNRSELNSLLIDNGRNCGERVWPFPMDKDFDNELKSNVADVLQCAAAGGGDHIQAARFLQRFVPDKTTWIHMDLSAATRTGGLGQVPTEITGFGVRYATSLILDNLEQLNKAKA
ncbi:MAG: leucyl aminopeptidase family protein [Gammaproteobacteria bacterium]|nr:leucyl aminopeptidase family protein [Gammaproteobacteria bacterium]MCP4091046.1 leucyl aminopeptidase family protein [Gammaproteobacteria bacterium]MCP4277428.1 leucyl aminopeptidase family protein [Gammaproteobacteria bacterium]MCP4831511.1 leucyl aminopeptidase family protein [Gammaproteobacteria bacterium]MCP4927734.1 leucyl aminopeptidase family protein [Gammaproteobacteria bacterium]